MAFLNREVTPTFTGSYSGTKWEFRTHNYPSGRVAEFTRSTSKIGHVIVVAEVFDTEGNPIKGRQHEFDSLR